MVFGNYQPSSKCELFSDKRFKISIFKKNYQRNKSNKNVLNIITKKIS